MLHKQDFIFDRVTNWVELSDIVQLVKYTLSSIRE